MKHLFCAITVATLLFCSCSNSDTGVNGSLSEEEQAKVERITKLAQENGWEFDSNLTEEQITEEILKMDEEEFTKLVRHIDNLTKTEGEIQE